MQDKDESLASPRNSRLGQGASTKRWDSSRNKALRTRNTLRQRVVSHQLSSLWETSAQTITAAVVAALARNDCDLGTHVSATTRATSGIDEAPANKVLRAHAACTALACAVDGLREGGEGELGSDILGCDRRRSQIGRIARFGEVYRWLQGARARPFTLKRVRQTLPTDDASKSTCPQMEISGRVVFDLSLGASTATTTYADGTQSTKPKSDGAPHATFLSEKFRRRPSDQLQAACAVRPLAHAHPLAAETARLSACAKKR